jgi:hypothetical protein
MEMKKAECSKEREGEESLTKDNVTDCLAFFLQAVKLEDEGNWNLAASSIIQLMERREFILIVSRLSVNILEEVIQLLLFKLSQNRKSFFHSNSYVNLLILRISL